MDGLYTARGKFKFNYALAVLEQRLEACNFMVHNSHWLSQHKV